MHDKGTALHYAAEAGHAKVVELLLTHDKIGPSARACEGTAPVSLAAVDVNAKDKKNKYTALHHAALHNRVDVVDLLLGVPTINVNAKAKYGLSSSMCAVIEGHCKVLKSLLKHPDIDVNPIANNEANVHGTTPLHNSSMNGHKDVVILLLAIKSVRVIERSQSRVVLNYIPLHTGYFSFKFLISTLKAFL